MPKPTEDMRELLRAIQTEIGAGKGFGSDQLTEVHNAACDRAIAIVRSYHDGVGLFQLTGEVAKMNWPDSCPSNEGAKPEVVTKPARNIPENIPMQACQPEPDNSCNPQSLQQKLAGAILDSEALTGILLDIVQERCDQDRTWGGPADGCGCED